MTQKKFYPEHNIRRSQLLTPFGIGSLFDINNQTVMIADSEFWDKDKCEIIHDERLEAIMNAKGFIEPPISDDTDSTQESSIAGVRFPQWYLSPKTRQIMPISKWRQLAIRKGKRALKRFDESPFNPQYNFDEKLVPVRFVCVCPYGHMQDFPWIEWAHSGKVCKNPKMRLLSSDRSGSLANYTVECENCRLKKSLGAISSTKAFSSFLEEIGVSCEGLSAWKMNPDKEKCNAKLQVLLRSASNLYFSNISSSVNIPIRSSTVIEKINSEDPKVQRAVNQLKAEFPNLDEDMMRKGIVENLKTKELSNSNVTKIMDYRRAEFNILSGIEKYDNSSNKLKETIFNKKELLATGVPKPIQSISLVHQLEVVNALRSFSRLKPNDSDSMKEIIREENENTKFSTEVSLYRRKDGYYVGMRSRGEGIFISLNVESVSSWMKEIQGSRIASRINNKIYNVGVSQDEQKYITPSYYLLHTLSHVLLKELSMSSGYSSTALKERLYYSDEPGKEMYGILIYTSSSDSEGTLGGLVKQGVPEKFRRVLSAAIEKARWCSFDPICIDSDGQGSNSLNAGACHACALISETSCEKMNRFLDRGVLIGGLDKEGSLGFFSDLD